MRFLSVKDIIEITIFHHHFLTIQSAEKHSFFLPKNGVEDNGEAAVMLSNITGREPSGSTAVSGA